MTKNAKIPGLLLGLLTLMGACQSSGGVDGSLLPRPEEPENLLAKTERSDLFFKLDQYTSSYMEARADGRQGAWRSLHESLLEPLVDANLAQILSAVGDDDEKAYRRIAARGLGFASDSDRVVPALLEQLTEPDPFLVVSSLASLYIQADPDTDLEPLADSLLHPDPDVRNNAALALGTILRARRRAGSAPRVEDHQVISGRLVGIVSNLAENDFVRGEAAAALGETGDVAATDMLVNLLDDDASVVRTKAAIGLGLLGREQAVPPLIDALSRTKSPTEQDVIGASISRIASTKGWPCDAKALGADPRNWRNWYLSVNR